MVTHNKVWICLFLIFCSGFVVGQPVKAPDSGASIVDLIETLDQNTKSTRVTAKKVEDLEGHIKEEFSSKWGIIVVGISAVIVGERLVLSLFGLIARKRKRKSYEEHIRDMQGEQREILKNVKTSSDELLRKTARVLNALEDAIIIQKAGSLNKLNLLIGFILGLLCFEVLKLVGVVV